MVKNLPANAGDSGSIPGLGRSLEEEMMIPSSILVWKIPWTEKPGGIQSTGSQSQAGLTGTAPSREPETHVAHL